MPPPLLLLHDISLTFGVAPLLSGATLAVAADDRICLVGRNGSGKSTLLQIAAGLVQADTGERFAQPGAPIQYLPQQPDLAGFGTTLAYVEAGFDSATVDGRYRALYLLKELGLSGDEDPASLSGTVISSSRIFRAVSLGTCFRITSRTRSTVLLLAATRHLPQHPQGHRPFTLAVTGRASRGRRGRCTEVRTAPSEPFEIYSRLITIEWPCPRARVRCGPREQRERERDRADELEYFYHKSQQLGSAHSTLVKPQEARRQSHRQSRLRPNRVRNILPAGGRWIRTSGSVRDKGSVPRFRFARELMATDGSRR
jgi:energy-coupling factor transporter ATP-binding protein EcfA2